MWHYLEWVGVYGALVLVRGRGGVGGGGGGALFDNAQGFHLRE